nr:MAG TPA: helix-turn-helix domain protein [Caudoviricetes sp.]
MGWKHDMWAWTANVDTPAECLTLLWLNQRADDDSGECFPSAEDIAAHTRLNRKTVFAALKSLTEKGLIETKKRPGPGRRNLYRLCYERTENGTSQKWNVPETVLSTSQKRDVQSTKNGTSNVPETVRETTIETTTESIRNQQEVMCAPSGAPYPEDFDQSLFDEAQREAQLAGEKTTDEPPMKEEKPKRKRSSNVQKPESVSEQVWNDFTALRTKRRAPITETALKGIQREAEKAGITLEEALSTCCERGWQGFKAEWYRREKLEQKNASKAEYQLPSNDDWDNFDTAHYA